jgi:hypothetical protein
VILIILLIGLLGVTDPVDKPNFGTQGDSLKVGGSSIFVKVEPIFKQSLRVRCSGRSHNDLPLLGADMLERGSPCNHRLILSPRRHAYSVRRLNGHTQWGDLLVLQWDLTGTGE